MTSALIVVDVQNDFVSGSLAVPGGQEVADKIHVFCDSNWDDYNITVSTQDMHPAELPGHFDDFPAHCVMGTPGAELAMPFGHFDVDYQFYKGFSSASFSGFDAFAFEANVSLDRMLRLNDITNVDICGIATDYCVLETVLDAIYWGYEVRVLSEMCAAVDPSNNAFDRMAAAGAVIL